MTRMPFVPFALATLLGACAAAPNSELGSPEDPPPRTEISVSGSASLGVSGVLR